MHKGIKFFIVIRCSTQKGDVKMEYNLTKGEVSVNETMLETTAEQPIDIDFTLPDYCPDINKILKCQVEPLIQNRSINGNKLDIEGNIKVRLMYLDEEKQIIRNFNYNSPFSMKVDLKNQNEEIINPIIYTNESLEYLNCRAISPRRMNINGAFNINIKIMAKSHKEIITGIEDEDIEQKLNNINVSSVVAETEKTFIISEILELAQDKPPIENIIRSSINPVLDEAKAIDGKVILKGEANIKIVYQSNSQPNNIESMEYSVPISQILSLEEVNENCTCQACIKLLNYSMQAKEDTDGNYSLIETEMHFISSIIAFEEKEISLISDAFSTKYDMKLEYKNVLLDKVQDPLNETVILKEIIETNKDNPISEIIDVYNEFVNLSSSIMDSKIKISGKYNICILAKNNENQPVYLEKLAEFEHYIDTENISDLAKISICQSTASINYRMTSSSDIEVKLEIKLNLTIHNWENYKCINYASADETEQNLKDENTSLIIYYAQSGENIWDIARKYKTSPECIKTENNINFETLASNTMLLIPV